ncbi:MAG: methylornithine synthase PylB [Candidatus Adiutrix sp.]
MGAQLEDILQRALAEETLSFDDLCALLSPPNNEDREKIWAAAREMRTRHSGKAIFTYGFVYLSTYCRNDCIFCAYRQSSPTARRYRKNHNEVLAAAKCLAQDGVNLIDLTMGEDPLIEDPDFIDELTALTLAVRAELDLPIMISPGRVSPQALEKFKQAGANWYALYQETHNPRLFERLRPGQSYEERWQAKLWAKKIGLLLEEGALCGVGETIDDLAHSILAMKDLGAFQVRTMGFVPPWEGHPNNFAPSHETAHTRELDMIAAMRLAIPRSLIPASLDVEGLAGLKQRLKAGANVITSLVPPDMNLAGVAQTSLDIENNGRSLTMVRPLVEAENLKLATKDEYLAWLQICNY